MGWLISGRSDSAASEATAAVNRPEEAAPEDPGDEVGAKQQSRHHHAEAQQKGIPERVGQLR
jgi:hypothetical protein